MEIWICTSKCGHIFITVYIHLYIYIYKYRDYMTCRRSYSLLFGKKIVI